MGTDSSKGDREQTKFPWRYSSTYSFYFVVCEQHIFNADAGVHFPNAGSWDTDVGGAPRDS